MFLLDLLAMKPMRLNKQFRSFIVEKENIQQKCRLELPWLMSRLRFTSFKDSTENSLVQSREENNNAEAKSVAIAFCPLEQDRPLLVVNGNINPCKCLINGQLGS